MKKLLWKCMLSFAGFVLLLVLTNLTAPSAQEKPSPEFAPWDKQLYTCIHEANEKIKDAAPCSTPDECRATLVPLIDQRKQYIKECMTTNGYPMKVKEEKK